MAAHLMLAFHCAALDCPSSNKPRSHFASTQPPALCNISFSTEDGRPPRYSLPPAINYTRCSAKTTQPVTAAGRPEEGIMPRVNEQIDVAPGESTGR